MEQALSLRQEVIVRNRIPHIHNRGRYGRILQAGYQRLVLRDIAPKYVTHTLHPILEGDCAKPRRCLEPRLPLHE